MAEEAGKGLTLFGFEIKKAKKKEDQKLRR